MADEIRIRAALSWAKSGSAGAGDSGELSVTMSGTKGLETRQTVAITEEALVLGEVTAANAHYWIRNNDASNPVDLKPAAGGTVTTRIWPGMVVMGRFGPSVTAPFVIAITAPVDIDVKLVQA